MPHPRLVPPAVVFALAAVLCLPAGAQETEVVAELFASDAGVTGGVRLTGSGAQVLGGSEVRAGDSTALLRLTRGGDVRICPRTAVSLTPAQDGRGLLLAMSTGALETRYTLPAASDSIMTPDFRIALTGPGRFHFAISSDARGNTCVRALPDNTASVIVSELMGSGQYQVKANEQVVFREGAMAVVESVAPPDCGCPAALQLHIAEAAPPAEPAPAPQEPGAPLPPWPSSPPSSAPAVLPQFGVPPARTPVAAAPRPALRSGELHVEVDAPFVFHAAPADAAPAPARADFLTAAVRLQAVNLMPPEAALRPPLPVPAADSAPAPRGRKQSSEKKGFFRRIGGFFAAVFGR